jgi:hypothetical protein
LEIQTSNCLDSIHEYTRFDGRLGCNNRWNNTMLGISDKVFFMFGHAISASIINLLRRIPITTIAAKLTPPGMDSTVLGE